jgi:hypothetical protein
MPKRYSRSNALCEKQAIREQEKELDLWSSKTRANGDSYLERGHVDWSSKTHNCVKQLHYKESTIENININIEWGQK